MENIRIPRPITAIIMSLIIIVCLLNCLNTCGFKVDRQLSRITKLCDYDFTDFRQIQKNKAFFQKNNSIYYFDSEQAMNFLKNGEEFVIDAILKKVYEPTGIIIDLKVINDQLLVIYKEKNQNKLAIMYYMNPKNAIIVNTDSEMFSLDLNNPIWYDSDIILCQKKDCKSVYIYDFKGNLQKKNKYENPVTCAYLVDNKVLIYENITRLEQTKEENIYYTNFDSESFNKIEVIADHKWYGLSYYLNEKLEYTYLFSTDSSKESFKNNTFLQEIGYEEETFSLISNRTIPVSGLKDSFWEDGIHVISYRGGLGWMKKSSLSGNNIIKISNKNFDYFAVVNAFHYRTPIFINNENNKTNIIACSIFDYDGSDNSSTTPDELHIFDYPSIQGKLFGVAEGYMIDNGKTGFFLLTDTGLYFAYTPLRYKDFGG